MPSREALQLAEQTGCLPTEAAAALEAQPEVPNALASITSIMAFRRKRYGSRLLEVWNSITGSTEAKEMDIDQTILFIQSLDLELEDPLVLAVAYELQAPRMGAIAQAGFLDGWARLEAGNLSEMKEHALPQLKKRFENDLPYFKEVYRFTFKFCLTDDGSRLLPLDSAIDYWNLLLAPRYADLTQKWNAFINQQDRAISNDTWNMVLEFFEYATNVDPNLEKYDETSAWPAVLDDFVEEITK